MAPIAVPTVARPDYLMPIVDPTFKTKVIRVGGTAGKRHSYSRIQPWNSDGTLAMLGSTDIIDGTTYQVVGDHSSFSSECYWSHNDPHRMWTFDPATNRLLSLNLTQNAQGYWSVTTTTVVKSFTGYSNMYMGRWEGSLSHDDRYAPFMARVGSDLHILVYDIVAGAVVSERAFANQWPAGEEPKMDWVSMSPSGTYVVMRWNADGQGPEQGVTVYKRDAGLSFWRHLVLRGEHGDLCYDAAGNEVWTQLVLGTYKPIYQTAVGSWRLDNGAMIRPLPLTWGSTGGHISCTNHYRPGWAYVTGQTNFMEVFAVKLEDHAIGGGTTAQRFVHHRSSAPPYSAEAQAAASPDGTKVMFASNWDQGSTGDVHGYVVEYPQTPPVQILPNAQAPNEVILSSATAQLRFYRNLWQAMTVTTPGGTTMPIVDLFFYLTYADQILGQYWTKPEIWDTAFSFQALPTLNGASTAVIQATRSGLTKKIFATVYPDDPAIYVVNQVSTSVPLSNVVDIALSYIPSDDPSSSMYADELIVDGTTRSMTQSWLGSQSSFLYLPNKSATLALLSAPANQQTLKINQPLFYYYPGGGSDMRIRGIDGQNLIPGETVDLRYVIYWNDGRKLDEVNALKQRLQAGELNGRFRTQ
jgi:hypothetical protein